MSQKSEIFINGDNNDNLIITFGGCGSAFVGEPPFEFLNFLSKNFLNVVDCRFYVDKNKVWYHDGLLDITTSIEETVAYLNSILQKKSYKKVIFMGSSAGGYAAILFGSLCEKVTDILAFMPQTTLKNPKNKNYGDLLPYVQNCGQNKRFFLHCSSKLKDELHCSSHCYYLNHLDYVNVIESNEIGISMKQLRDSGKLKNILNNILVK